MSLLPRVRRSPGAAGAPAHASRSLADSHYTRHGASLFRMAHLICQDADQAEDAVVQALAATASAGTFSAVGRETARELARLTFLACSEVVPEVYQPVEGEPAATSSRDDWIAHTGPHRRALLALVVHGRHTYDEAAALLGVAPASAAQTLRSTLRSVPSPPYRPDDA